MNAFFATVAITAATVFTGDGPPLENATVVIDGSRIQAVGVGVPIPADAQVIDASGAVLTPGLVDAVSRLGVEDVSLEASSVEGTAGAKADDVRAALLVADTFNPASFVIPVARAGGITSALVVPRGGLISGQSVWVDLIDRQPVRKKAAALHLQVGGIGEGAGRRSRAFLRLNELFEDMRLYRANRGPYITRKLRPLSLSAEDLKVLDRMLDRKLRVVIEVDRAQDIRTVLTLVRKHRLRAVLLGAAEGWVVADEIANAKIPVLVDPLDNLPGGFNRLRARNDNAARLHAAGVTVGITLRGDAQRAGRLRFAAGNAVADGLPYGAALAAITRVPAQMFGITDAGVLRAGAIANLVVWNGDPLELETWAVRMFIRGVEVPLRSRQDQLTERYAPAR